MDKVKIVQGDTDKIPYGFGSFASRSITIGGSAVAGAAVKLGDQLRALAAHLMEVDIDSVELDGDSGVRMRKNPDRRLSYADLAFVAYLQSPKLPKDIGPGLRASASFDMLADGVFSNATHGVVVELDPGTGGVQILRYVCVEDVGVAINPQVVEGQARGGIAQGIAGALFEEVNYDANGQPLAPTFMEYKVPTAMEIPDIRIEHLETPCALTESGAKRREGGTIGAPAAVLNAVNDGCATPVSSSTTLRFLVNSSTAHSSTRCAHLRRRSRLDENWREPMSEVQLIELTVNGQRYDLAVEPRRTLVDVLRHDLRLTGTHVGCEHGICGACTILVDGAPARACLMFAAQVEGADIRTVESLANSDGSMGDLQQCFSENHGLQCGFCTPGFLMLAEGFLREELEPTREEIREVVASNICRCTGYQTIVDAVEDCAGRRRAALQQALDQQAAT